MPHHFPYFSIFIISNHFSLPGYIGEVGLSGEIRTVTRIEQRVAETQKLGFDKVFIPKGNLKGVKDKFTISIVEVGKVEELFKAIFA